MIARLLHHITRAGQTILQALRRRVLAAMRPAPPLVVAGVLADLARGKGERMVEHALLRQQLVLLKRSITRPRCTAVDRTLLVLLASRARAWRQALLLVQPDTLLRGHRDRFRHVWRRRSRPRSAARTPKAPPETIALIREMASANPPWGAERIRGELLKLGIGASKRTIQRYLRPARPPRRSGQRWSVFLRNHATEIWACDFLPVTDLTFRPLYAFCIIALGSRRVIHVGVTRHPTDAWVAQQLREATPLDERPRFLIRDNDGKYGPRFDPLAIASGIRVLRTPIRAPRANVICERCLGSVRRERADQLLILGEAHLRRVLRVYASSVNTARPHQGRGQAIPGRPVPTPPFRRAAPIVAIPVPGGRHHGYRRAA
jgi:hypothetical protein